MKRSVNEITDRLRLIEHEYSDRTEGDIAREAIDCIDELHRKIVDLYSERIASLERNIKLIQMDMNHANEVDIACGNREESK